MSAQQKVSSVLFSYYIVCETFASSRDLDRYVGEHTVTVNQKLFTEIIP